VKGAFAAPDGGLHALEKTQGCDDVHENTRTYGKFEGFAGIGILLNGQDLSPWRGRPETKKMLKTKVDPTICMKIKGDMTLCPKQKTAF
jgi:hypothetical protein